MRKWTDATVAADLREISKRLQRFPTTADLRREKRVDLLKAADKRGGLLAWAKKLGIPREAHDGKTPKGKEPGPTGEGMTCEIKDDAQVITAVSSTVRTLEDALRVAKVDTAVWRVARWVANKWDTVAKLKGNDADTLAACELWQVKVWLERRVPKLVQDGCEYIAALIKPAKHAKIVRPASIRGPHMLELDLPDAHFGKLAWAAETGEDYDLRLADQVYRNAIQDLIGLAKGFPLELITLPIGNDFFHIDSPENKTTNGTPQDVDGRMHKIFGVGLQALIYGVEYALRFAPVHVIHVSGNHDRLTSWYVVQVLKAHFRNSRDVTFDDSPKPRKYIRYGNTLIGLTHGDEEKHASLPTIMATEVPELWAQTVHHEWRLGHFHKAKQTQHVAVDTHDGVTVRVLQSLSGTDAWHKRRGYVGTRRAATAHVSNKTMGHVGQFTAYARTA